MTVMLGNKYCIESLQDDLADVQATVHEVLSYTGPLPTASWKYPNQESCSLRLDELLPQLQYEPKDEMHSTMAHATLLELLIDRFLLLFQLEAAYIDSASICAVGETQSILGKSVGLAVKRHWEKLHPLCSGITLWKSETKRQSLTGCSPLQVLAAPSTRASSPGISKDWCSKSSQTEETLLVPCDACMSVQRNLRQVGRTLVRACSEHDLPSALARLTWGVDNREWMNASHVVRWCVEQDKDVTLLSSHFKSMQEVDDQLRSQLMEAQRECKKLKENLRAEEETRGIQLKQHQAKLSSREHLWAEEKSKLQTQLLAVEKDRNALQAGLLQHQQLEASLQQQVQIQSQENASMAQQLQAIQGEMEALQKERKSYLETEESFKALKSTVADLVKSNQNLKRVGDEMETRVELLSKQSADLRSKLESQNQENAVLTKVLTELKHQHVLAIDARADTDKALHECREALQEKQQTVQDLNVERANCRDLIEKLKDEVSLLKKEREELQEREKLLVEYPDLYRAADANLTGTGDIVQDMQRQVSANSIRIQVLEKQNCSLRNSLSKLLAASKSREISPENDAEARREGECESEEALPVTTNGHNGMRISSRTGDRSDKVDTLESSEGTCVLKTAARQRLDSARGDTVDSGIALPETAQSTSAWNGVPVEGNSNACVTAAVVTPPNSLRSSRGGTTPCPDYKRGSSATGKNPALISHTDGPPSAQTTNVAEPLPRKNSSSTLLSTSVTTSNDGSSTNAKSVGHRQQAKGRRLAAHNVRKEGGDGSPTTAKPASSDGVVKLSSLNSSCLNTYIKLKRTEMLKRFNSSQHPGSPAKH
ncbi:PREDICTED: coiled-coil domain-containing protein 157-like [Priapulus caudatus]|uniref:Coiled-coil domain-containing protein 157-like n=1 Tax=Priapulus caudatus TaxID=37621 RepID=A0ABM1EE46_PRICU|nr:PREDICTED: coiled-coil domain-containing protein 157-like [Priapulus caudatus]